MLLLFIFHMPKVPVTGSAHFFNGIEWVGPVWDTFHSVFMNWLFVPFSLFQEDAGRVRMSFSGFLSPIRANSSPQDAMEGILSDVPPVLFSPPSRCWQGYQCLKGFSLGILLRNLNVFSLEQDIQPKYLIFYCNMTWSVHTNWAVRNFALKVSLLITITSPNPIFIAATLANGLKIPTFKFSSNFLIIHIIPLLTTYSFFSPSLLAFLF